MLRSEFFRLSAFSLLTSFALMSSCAFTGGDAGSSGQPRTALDAKTGAGGKRNTRGAKNALATLNTSTSTSTPTMNGATPTMNGATPTMNGATPTMNGATPTMNGATPTENGSTPTGNEAKRRQRNQHIVGEVRLILKGKHDALPEFEAQTTDSKEEPTARVINETPYPLTVWFAGPCSKKLGTPIRGSTEIRLCTGTYNIAAKVGSPDFFPLVRENQVFDRGMDYVLQIIIRAKPSTINKH